MGVALMSQRYPSVRKHTEGPSDRETAFGVERGMTKERPGRLLGTASQVKSGSMALVQERISEQFMKQSRLSRRIKREVVRMG